MSFLKLHGIHIEHHKNTAHMKAVAMPAPKEVIIPMNMHIGALAKPIVKIGDKVLVGQKIAESNGYISSNIHAPVSGKIKKIEDMLASNGNYVPSIVIESDGVMEMYSEIKPIELTDTASFASAVQESGIVGLGGAGFPTFVKLAVKDLSKIEEVVINCAECEPYITADTRTMIDNISLVEEGVKLLEKYLGAKKIIFGIENNKPEAIKNLKELASRDSHLIVDVLKSVYPQGGEKVLIFNTTGKVVPEGKLPLDVGVVIINVTTLAEIAKYIKTGMPLINKVLTVDGSCVKNPQNVIVPIGTPLKDVFEFCGGFKQVPYKVLYGGPMMGIAVPSLDVPVIKTTNAILAFNKKEALIPEPSACIKCGRCVNNCPLNLDPVGFAKARELKDMATLEKLKVNLCMECGVCSYVCPAKRPLVQNNRLAKSELRSYLAKKKEDEQKNANKESK